MTKMIYRIAYKLTLKLLKYLFKNDELLCFSFGINEYEDISVFRDVYIDRQMYRGTQIPCDYKRRIEDE